MSGFEINHCVVSGNLTFDPELRSLPSGTSLCQLRIAHNGRRKNGATGEWEDETHYFSVTVWSGIGEWVARNLAKGDKVVVSGRMRYSEWQDKETGKTRSKIDINAESVVPIPKGGRETTGGGGGGGGGFTPRSDVPVDTGDFTPRGGAPGGGGFQPQTTPDDDIPF